MDVYTANRTLPLLQMKKYNPTMRLEQELQEIASNRQMQFTKIKEESSTIAEICSSAIVAIHTKDAEIAKLKEQLKLNKPQ